MVNDYTTSNQSTYTTPVMHPRDTPNASIKRDDHLVEWNKKESVRKALMKDYDKMLGMYPSCFWVYTIDMDTT